MDKLPDDEQQSNHQQYSWQIVHYGLIEEHVIFLVLSQAHSTNKLSLQPNELKLVLVLKWLKCHKFQLMLNHVREFHNHFSLIS